MSTAIDQKAYLQRYLKGPSADKKKKKKKAVKGKGFKIIDDDIDLTKLRPLDGDELDILNEGEDAPQIAGIIDDRPDELKKLDYETSKWRVINQDDGFNSKLQVQEVKKDKKEIEKENEVVFGKMYSDSEDEKPNSPERNNETTKKNKHNSDSDFSPPRKSRNNHDSDASPQRNGNRNDGGSPYRRKSSKRTVTENKKYDSDVSSPRKHTNKPSKSRAQKNDSDSTPPRKKTHSLSRKNYDSDASPPRNQSKNDKGKSRRKNDDSDASPKRKNRSELRKNYDSDISRHKKGITDKSKSRKHNDSDESPSRRKNHTESRKSYDSDVSPPRKRINEKQKSNASDFSPQRKKKNYDSDFSPPRKHENKTKERVRKPSRWGGYDESCKKQQSQSPDASRKRNSRSPERNRNQKSKNYDSDISPPRKRKTTTKRHKNSDSDSDLSPPRKNKMEKTLDGKKAGLQSSGHLKNENAAFRRREDEAFRNMTDEMSGRNAHAVSRKGKRETSEDRQKQREKAERQKELDEKYKKWSKGLKQIEAQQAAVHDYIHESSKPLARYKDDRDLETKLKDVQREGDPMLQYIREKKKERGELGPEKPMYKGNFPPNRFNIRPGYRWDGVDRSNGYEKKFFENQSKRRAQEEEAYKWSTEDL